ncbi:molecular chaperone [Stenotrophomonas maltophilia]|uniref:fimbrial biogenesis chaperone n=1 Tax=Stenotrophomonas maltophilia TaxID=40324 RepID=UPI0006ACD5A0|nr:molecular chaperone [Stenotrophomonas maltophilia]MBA0397437.1 molecular chaperone [Stenotrophomonas maltophilia]QGL76380.1 molecular chaperone [Stenotrophomonas maltophilia]
MHTIAELNVARLHIWGCWRRLVGTCILLLGGAFTSVCWAQVSMPGTRVVYPGKQAEVVVPLKNVSASPVLVQTWVSDDDADQLPEQSGAPFVLAPPVLRLQPAKDANLRIRQISARAPTDAKEHLYWLNVLAIPPSAESSENKLELAVRSRYKLLFRPPTLPPPPADRMQGVTLSVRRGHGNGFLVVSNSTAYYLNLGRVSIVAGGKQYELDNPFAPPFGEAAIALPDGVGAGVMEVRFSWLDDNGALHPVTRQVDTGSPL